MLSDNERQRAGDNISDLEKCGGLSVDVPSHRSDRFVFMRDPRRIDRMMELLYALWRKYPDWRLAQLVLNAHAASEAAKEPYSVEDDLVEVGLRRSQDLRMIAIVQLRQHKISTSAGFTQNPSLLGNETPFALRTDRACRQEWRSRCPFRIARSGQRFIRSSRELSDHSFL